ncbi:phytanoyl-CoA dioxygenase family protein [Pigmentiphaga sp.]|jgi:Protein involved in biosynthesis of mitomycin antibiotics/polyketide fumonisin|uniref:phytanoyl-CoA dioxygenase family protein n=1 Tax=Pigmentiphaga sp. TaxID=1977564 RepID=UPI0025E8BB69|nr:phytanoyl-CoA dioxygenase family protein [Pigmentiphaga sp.]MBX6318423.1 phytanoyl-CoA dioxygenase family protein [Pigmentiphaga sp.]
MASLSRDEQIATLRRDGLVVVRNFLDASRCAALLQIARAQLNAHIEPIEYEADLGYPGAPPSRDAEGGKTVRRLLDAWSRDEAFRQYATSAPIREWMAAYFGEPAKLSLAHHNCIMTKHPRFGTLTGWHRDFRYWAFERDDMVSVWLALGDEFDRNGALHFVPGSHLERIDASRFDEKKFFRDDLPVNRPVIERAIVPELHAGDAVFFHCNTLHAADRNSTDEVKFSVVFTYHAASNRPLPGTRSAAKGSVHLENA